MDLEVIKTNKFSMGRLIQWYYSRRGLTYVISWKYLASYLGSINSGAEKEHVSKRTRMR